MFVHTGDYIEQTSTASSLASYYTFTPRPLMDGGFYTMDDDLASLLAETHKAIGILEGVLLSFPGSDLFSELMLLKESSFNKMIDYLDFDFRSVLINQGLGKADDETYNIMSAYRHVRGSNAQKANFNDIARCALYGIGSEQKINARNKQIFLTNSASNYLQYNPTAPGDIHSTMNDINKYIELSGVDVLIKAAMCHYQFEMIHPYECYNGIVGRIFVYKMLHSAGMTGVRYLSLSECLYHQKAEYFDKLGQAQKHGSYSAWIEFFVRAIGEAARMGIELTKSYIEITRRDDEILSDHDKKRHTGAVYSHFKKNVMSSVGQASEHLQLPFNAVSRAIEVLQSLGILTQITSQSRNRLFAHADLMRLILSD